MKTGNEFEKHYVELGYHCMGIDEAGRGPIAGPLVVACVIFPQHYENEEIYDSKKLSEKKRERLFKIIIKEALYYKILIIEPKIIDEQNIYRATQNAMFELSKQTLAEVILTDAMPLAQSDKIVESIIKGDQKSVSIAAASILAKVLRDHIMMGYDCLYPQYGFKAHKGYPTKRHIEALDQYGLLPIYRYSYGPVSSRMK